MSNVSDPMNADKLPSYWSIESAIERFRMYSPRGEFLSVSDDAVAEALSDRVQAAIDAGQTFRIVQADNGVPCIAVRIRVGPTGISIAILQVATKNLEYPKRGARTGLVITGLVSLVVANRYMLEGTWKYATPEDEVRGKPLLRVELPSQKPKEKEPVVVKVENKSEYNRNKPARGGNMVERCEYVRQILRDRPGIRAAGTDGIIALVKAKFGMGMGTKLIGQLRESVQKEKGQTSGILDTGRVSYAEAQASKVKPTTLRPIPSPAVEAAQALPGLIQDKEMAGNRLATATKAYEEARNAYEEAQDKVNDALRILNGAGARPRPHGNSLPAPQVS